MAPIVPVVPIPIEMGMRVRVKTQTLKQRSGLTPAPEMKTGLGTVTHDYGDGRWRVYFGETDLNYCLHGDELEPVLGKD